MFKTRLLLPALVVGGLLLLLAAPCMGPVPLLLGGLQNQLLRIDDLPAEQKAGSFLVDQARRPFFQRTNAQESTYYAVEPFRLSSSNWSEKNARQRIKTRFAVQAATLLGTGNIADRLVLGPVLRQLRVSD